MAVSKFPVDSCRKAVDAIVDKMDAGAAAGYFRIYSGTQPSDPDSVGTGTLLAQCTASDPAFGSAVDIGGSARATANAISPDTSANATGVAGWFRAYDSNGNYVFQGDVTATGGGGAMTIDDVNIDAGGQVTINSCTVTMSQT